MKTSEDAIIGNDIPISEFRRARMIMGAALLPTMYVEGSTAHAWMANIAMAMYDFAAQADPDKREEYAYSLMGQMFGPTADGDSYDPRDLQTAIKRDGAEWHIDLHLEDGDTVFINGMPMKFPGVTPAKNP